jgi:tripartite-type tricarboxylate transporter receptor subunit TctC
VKTLAELVARARTTKLAYASGGAGVPGHLSMELLQTMAAASR